MGDLSYGCLQIDYYSTISCPSSILFLKSWDENEYSVIIQIIQLLEKLQVMYIHFTTS